MISGNQIYFRAMEPEDADLLYAWENDTEVWRVSSTVIPYSKHYLKEFISRSNNNIFSDGQVRLMIMLKETNICVGTLDLFEHDPINLRAGIGILIDRNYRNAGIASEAVQIAINYAFSILNMHQLFCHVVEDNLASIKLFQKSGFTITGTKKHWVIEDRVWKDTLFMQLINTD